MYLKFQIKIPKLIENIFVYFLLRYRKKKYGEPFRRIKLIQQNRKAKPVYTKVDSEDYEKLTQYDWQLFDSDGKRFYAVRLDNRKIVHIHRVIMNAPKGIIVDHKDRDGLNNTKQNLRFATISQNAANTGKSKSNTTSKYKGVLKTKRRKKWYAKIKHKGKAIHLGSFHNEEDAARAYDEAAKKLFGEFAFLNFKDDSRKVVSRSRVF